MERFRKSRTGTGIGCPTWRSRYRRGRSAVHRQQTARHRFPSAMPGPSTAVAATFRQTREHWGPGRRRMGRFAHRVGCSAPGRPSISRQDHHAQHQEVVANPVVVGREIAGRHGHQIQAFSAPSAMPAAATWWSARNSTRYVRPCITLAPGDSEDKLASIVRPEDMSFTRDGLVMVYPRFLPDFYVREVSSRSSSNRPSSAPCPTPCGRVLRSRSALGEVTPADWRHALPSWAPQESAEDEDAGPAFFHRTR